MSHERIVLSKEGTLLYTDTTAKKICTLPVDARIIRITCFTAATATSGVLDVGILGALETYVADLDVSTAGSAQAPLLNFDRNVTQVDVYAVLAGLSAGGPFTIVIEYDTSRSLAPK
jgi:hypothetical protein